MPKEQWINGSCLCGAVKFKVTNLKPHIGHCHCQDCRKFHGAAFSTFIEVSLSDVQWIAGKEFLIDYVADNQSTRQFCRNCGSSLTFCAASQLGQSIEIAAACFDEPANIQPDAHIFVASKVPWMTLNDNLAKWQKHRG